MDLAFIILAIGLAFYINRENNIIDKRLIKELDKVLASELKKRDDRIKELEDKINNYNKLGASSTNG